MALRAQLWLARCPFVTDARSPNSCPGTGFPTYAEKIRHAPNGEKVFGMLPPTGDPIVCMQRRGCPLLTTLPVLVSGVQLRATPVHQGFLGKRGSQVSPRGLHHCSGQHDRYHRGNVNPIGTFACHRTRPSPRRCCVVLGQVVVSFTLGEKAKGCDDRVSQRQRFP